MPGVNHSSIAPRAISDLLDDLAVEVDLVMRRKGMRLSDLERARFDYSPTQVKKISAWLRGTHTQMRTAGGRSGR